MCDMRKFMYGFLFSCGHLLHMHDQSRWVSYDLCHQKHLLPLRHEREVWMDGGYGCCAFTASPCLPYAKTSMQTSGWPPFTIDS